MSFFGIGAAAGGAATTAGAIGVAGVAGAVAAGAFAVATTQVAANVTQPDPTKANSASQINQPNYADN